MLTINQAVDNLAEATMRVQAPPSLREAAGLLQTFAESLRVVKEALVQRDALEVEVAELRRKSEELAGVAELRVLGTHDAPEGDGNDAPALA